MTTTEFIEYMNSGKQVTAECGVHQTIHRLGRHKGYSRKYDSGRHSCKSGEEHF